MEKKQVLQQALKQLNNMLKKEMNLDSDEGLFSVRGYVPGNVATVTISSDLLALEYTVLLQAWTPQKDMNALMAQIKSLPAPALLFADFVNPVMVDKFRRRAIAFIDCAGNASIKNKQFELYVKGRRSSQLRSKRKRGRAFNAAGLKLIFALFNKPQFLQASYRDISNKVNIALGSVGPVIDDLYSSGYIIDDGERRLINKKRLFERWVDGYLEKLRPKQIINCYRSDDEHWWKKINPVEYHGLWGGEVVIAKSTPFMTPETISLYFSSEVKLKDFVNVCNLHEDVNGEICIYRNFWSPSYAGDDNVDGLSSMIVYADIVDSINPGSWDVAKTFYGEAIAKMLRD